jgi:hypothetical protein
LPLDDVQVQAIVIPITPAFEAKDVLFRQWFDEANRRVLGETGEKLRAEGVLMEEIIEVSEKVSLKGSLVVHHCSATLAEVGNGVDLLFLEVAKPHENLSRFVAQLDRDLFKILFRTLLYLWNVGKGILVLEFFD